MGQESGADRAAQVNASEFPEPSIG